MDRKIEGKIRLQQEYYKSQKSTIKAEDAYMREQIVMRINPEENRVLEMESDIRKPLINSAAKVRCGFHKKTIV